MSLLTVCCGCVRILRRQPDSRFSCSDWRDRWEGGRLFQHLIWILSVESIYLEVNGRRHSSCQGLELFQKGDIHACRAAQVHITEMQQKRGSRVRAGDFCEAGWLNPNTKCSKVNRQFSLFSLYRWGTWASFSVNLCEKVFFLWLLTLMELSSIKSIWIYC